MLIIYMPLVNKISKYPDVQALACQELCFEKNDVPESETAQRIMEIVERKNSRNKDTSLKEIPTPISDAFYCFSHGYPISENNRKKIIEFFKNEKNTKLGGEVFSSIYLLDGDENSLFINSFLKNGGKKDISNFVEYVLNELENYPFTIDFEYDEIIEIKDKGIIENTRAFIYKNGSQKSIIITNKEGEFFALANTYEKFEYRKNGTFCGIKKDGNGISYGEYIKLVDGEYKTIGKINNIKEIPNLSDPEGNLIYTSTLSKKGLQKFEKQLENPEGLKVKLIEKLRAEYDDIKIENGLIFASNNLDSKSKNIDIYGKDYKKIETINNVNSYEYIKGIEDKTIIKFLTLNGTSYYEIKIKGEIKAIKYLQNVKARLRPNPISEIYNNINSGRCVFIKYRPNDKNRLVIKNGEQYFYHEFEGTSIYIIPLEKITWAKLDKTIYSTYDINGKIYIYDKTNKKLYKLKRKYNTPKDRTFNDIQDNLDKLPLVQFENNV